MTYYDQALIDAIVHAALELQTTVEAKSWPHLHDLLGSISSLAQTANNRAPDATTGQMVDPFFLGGG